MNQMDTDMAVSSATEEVRESNRFQEGFRKLDSMNAASMDYREMAAMIDLMKKHVRIAKKTVINKLSRKIKTLKSKTKDAEDEKQNSKVQKLIDEIAMIKTMESSRISKFALANEDTVDSLSKKSTVTPHLLSLTRLAEEKALKSFVQKWRTEHDDWRVLANFILSKNTSRHFKRSVQKHRITKDSLLVERELLHKRLDTQEGLILTTDVNRPIVPRTSKSNKYKKKRKEQSEDLVDAQPTTVDTDADATTTPTSEPLAEEVETGSSDEADVVAEDPDLYTFNIVDEDMDLIKDEGREVTVSQEERSQPVGTKAKLFANKLFSSSTSGDHIDTSSGEDSESDDESTSSPTEETVELKELSSKGIETNAVNKKPKLKKSTGAKGKESENKFTESLKDTKADQVCRPKTNSESVGEMVKAVLNIDELHSQDTILLPMNVSRELSSAQLVPRRKKSAFFLGGADEIDESLGTNREEQERARRNQKVLGYKGLRNKERKLLESTFTESLKYAPQRRRKPESTDNRKANSDNNERFQKPSHQSKNFANKQKGNSWQKNQESNSVNKFSKYQSNSNAANVKKEDTNTESLHPSWQASKKRKEQLELMKKGPQGKKIKFDDDD